MSQVLSSMLESNLVIRLTKDLSEMDYELAVAELLNESAGSVEDWR